MVNRLSASEAMYFFLDGSGVTNHLGALMVFPAAQARGQADTDENGATDDGAAAARNAAAKNAAAKNAADDASATLPSRRPALDYPSLVALVESRLQLAPRYRQVVHEVTLGLARPVWADDPDFDINFHIRRSGLPRPGSVEDLQDLIARVMARPLDRTRPLWEMYLIEGLADGGVALLTKSHRCLLDDHTGPEISQVICDDSPVVRTFDEDLWMPSRPPGSASLAIGALAEALSRPGSFIDSVAGSTDLVAGARSVVEGTARRVGGVVRQLTDVAPRSPLNSAGSASRMFTVASVPWRDCAKIAQRHGCTVNDVELAIITGVMRRWLLSFDVSAGITDTVRAVLPLHARDPSVQQRIDTEGTWINVGKPSFVTDLPVGEDNPTVRLAQVAGLANRYAASPRRFSETLRPMFPELGMVPFPEISSRAFRSLNRRSYNVPVSMGTAPIADRYVLGHRVAELYGVPALVSGRALAISVTGYAGRLYFTFVADRGVIGDLPAMTDYVAEAFEELASTQGSGS
ncbi:wax ester/triacylglycerol synthase family O-acyltransferase [Gordonia sinesedis]